MSQEEKRQATSKAPRTDIEDLPPPAEELSEEEAALAAGGALNYISPRYPSLSTGSTEATRVPNTCTAGNALSGSDTDYGND